MRTLSHIILMVAFAAGFPAAAEAGPRSPAGPDLGTPAAPARSPAQESDPATDGTPGRALRVFLLTMDQGDEVWERFGHNAILIQDESTGEALTWNWGLFDFDQMDFLPRFLRGEMLYSMGPAPLDPFIRSYVRAERSVYANEIHLSPEQARELDAFVRWNYLPENRDYFYDYYGDNCSTRVRDALDLVLGGILRERFEDRTTPYTYRWHSRRLVQETLWLDQGLSLLLGSRGDRPITEWQAMFVPMELMELLEEVDVDDGAGDTRPLLGPREVLFESSRPPTPDAAPAFSVLWLLAGLLVAGVLVLLGRMARGEDGASGAPGTADPAEEEARRGAAPAQEAEAAAGGKAGARIGLAVLAAVWSAIAGLLGLLLVLAWFTDHVFIHRNVNVLYTNPLLLVAGGAVLAVALRDRWWRGLPGRLVVGLVLFVAALSILGILLQATGLVHQGNAEVIALAVPVNVGFAVGLRLATTTSSPEARSLREPSPRHLDAPLGSA